MASQTGIYWGATDPRDSAYRWKPSEDGRYTTAEDKLNSKAYGNESKGGGTGFNVAAWFRDNAPGEAPSYYRYAKIRGIDNALARKTMASMGQDMYTSASKSAADTMDVAAQNRADGIDDVDTYGRPLTESVLESRRRQAGAVAMRSANAGGIRTTGAPLDLSSPGLLQTKSLLGG